MDDLADALGAPGDGAISAIIDLQACLLAIAKLDPSNPAHSDTANYDQRNVFVVQALGYAMAAGYPCGFASHPDAPPECIGFGLVYITLPTGQVSWHLPVYPDQYDGHTTPDKYARIAEYLSHAPGA